MTADFNKWQDGIYNTGGWNDYDTMTGYLSQLPTDVTSGLMRMSREVHKINDAAGSYCICVIEISELDVGITISFIQLNLNLNTITGPIT